MDQRNSEKMVTQYTCETTGFKKRAIRIDHCCNEYGYLGNLGKNKKEIDIWIGEEANLNKFMGPL